MNDLENIKYKKAMLEEYKEKMNSERTQNYIKQLENENEQMFNFIVRLYILLGFEIPDNYKELDIDNEEGEREAFRLIKEALNE